MIRQRVDKYDGLVEVDCHTMLMAYIWKRCEAKRERDDEKILKTLALKDIIPILSP